MLCAETACVARKLSVKEGGFVWWVGGLLPASLGGVLIRAGWV
jgi:hypothetical protein